jgi:5'-3' exonuclease
MDKIKKTDHFYLIDGSGYIFRAYYALPPLTRKSDGLPVGAVSGFCSMLFKLLEDSKSNENLQKPTHFAVIFDAARKTFRNEIYSDYKANRSEAPDDLAPQFEYIRKSVVAFNLPSVDLPNYEADDLIATYAEQIIAKGAKVTIVSSDKDLMQLYRKDVRIFDPMKNKFITPDDLAPQFEYIRKSVVAFNLPSVDLSNYEADDLIATYVEQILAKGAKVTIVSSDKDLMQLYKKDVRIFDPMKNKFITPEDIVTKFGVGPEKVIDVQSLAGDSSDNVPGVPGIGVKTAAELINKYGTLEKLLDNAQEIKQNKRRETLIENKDKAIISKKISDTNEGCPS